MQTPYMPRMSRVRATRRAAGETFDTGRMPLHCHSILRELGLAVRADQSALILQSGDSASVSYRMAIRVSDEQGLRLQLDPIAQPAITPAPDTDGWIEQIAQGTDRISHLRALLWRDSDIILMVDLSRKTGDEPFTAPDIRTLQHIAPGLALALRGTMKCAPLSLATDVFRRLPFGVALLDAERRVQFPNAAMLTILKRRDSLAEDAQILRARTTSAQRVLARAVRQILSGEIQRSGLMVLPREHGRPAYLATAERFHAGYFMLGQREPAVRLTVVDPDHSNDKGIAHIAEHFKLTPSEIDVVQAMVLGLDVAECAQRLQLAVNTVRWHQKRIFAKTGTSGRSALILLFIRGSQLHGA